MLRSWWDVPSRRRRSWAKLARRFLLRQPKAVRCSCSHSSSTHILGRGGVPHRFWWACAALFFFAILRVGPVAADEQSPFRLCSDPDNLPFSSPTGALPGFYIEVGRAVAQELGRRFEPVWAPTYYGKREIRRTLLRG